MTERSEATMKARKHESAWGHACWSPWNNDTPLHKPACCSHQMSVSWEVIVYGSITNTFLFVCG